MYQNRYHLRDLHDADILSNARSRTVAKLCRIRSFLTRLGAKLTGIQYRSNFLTSSDSASQRSGLKNSASSPKTSRLAWATQGLIPTSACDIQSVMLEQKRNETLLTPLGKRCPQISAPPSGTILPKVKPVAGWILILSLSTA